MFIVNVCLSISAIISYFNPRIKIEQNIYLINASQFALPKKFQGWGNTVEWFQGQQNFSVATMLQVDKQDRLSVSVPYGKTVHEQGIKSFDGTWQTLGKFEQGHFTKMSPRFLSVWR